MDNRSNNHNLQNGYYNNTERALLAARRASRNTVINGDSRSIRTDSVLPQTYAFFLFIQCVYLFYIDATILQTPKSDQCFYTFITFDFPP